MKEFAGICGESSYSKCKLTRELNTLKDWWQKGNILDVKGIEVYCDIFNRPIKLKRKKNEWCLQYSEHTESNDFFLEEDVETAKLILKNH